MKTEKIITWAIIGAAAYIFFGEKLIQFSAKFKVGTPRLRIKTLRPTGVDVELVLPVINNSNTPIQIDDLDVQIYYSNEQIASTKLNRPVSIKAGDTTPIYLNLFIPYAGLSVSVVNLIQTGQFETNVLADGTITSAGVTIPFTQTITLI